MIHFTEPSYDIACIGDTAGFDLMFAEYFSAAGLRCKVFRHTGTKKNISAQLTPHSDSKQSFSLNDIVYFEKRTSFIKEMQNFRCIASIGGALPVFLGRKYWPFRNLLNLPPVIQITTGSDVMERSIEKSFPGRMFRQYLKFTKLNVMVPYPLVLKNRETVGELQKKGIYTGRRWNSVLSSASSDSFEYFLSEYMVPIPVDQRYGRSEILYIYNCISDIMGS